MVRCARARLGHRLHTLGFAVPARNPSLPTHPNSPVLALHVTKRSHIVSYGRRVQGLSGSTRRTLLDELFKEDAQTLSALERRLPISRSG